MPNVQFKIKQDKAELWKTKVTVTSVAAATINFPFGKCDCTVESNVSTGDLSLGILQVYGHAHVRSHDLSGVAVIILICKVKVSLWKILG